MPKIVQVKFDVCGVKKSYRLDLESSADTTDMLLAISGFYGVAAYARSLTDDQLDHEIETMYRWLVPLPWDRSSRTRAIRLMAEKERRLNAIGRTWDASVTFAYEAAAA